MSSQMVLRQACLGLVAVALLLAFVAPSATTLIAQARETVLTGTPVCPQCRLTVSRVVTLGKIGDPQLIANILFEIGITRQGGFLVPAVDGTMILFDSTGAFRRVIGRRGQAPNEFPRSPSEAYRGAGDTTYFVVPPTIYVYDGSFHEQRRFRFGSDQTRTSLAGGGVLLISGTRGDLPLTANPLTSMGGFLTPFVIRGTQAPNECSRCSYVDVSAARAAGEFWVAFRGEYVLQRWNSAGSHQATLRVEPSRWFQEWMTQMRRGWMRPEPDVPIMRVRERSDELLVVSALGPAASVTDLYSKQPRSVPAMMMNEESNADIIFDVLDPTRGVLATARVANRFLRPLEGGRLAWRLIEDSGGLVQIEIWEIVFTRN